MLRPRPPYFSVFIISAAALAYEVLLMRLFSIIQWHHFAYMVISMALLGYGASGTFLFLTRQRLMPRFADAFVANTTFFGLSSIGCYLLAQLIPFNTLEIIWDPGQWLFLLLNYLLLLIPFFFAANAICLSFIKFNQQIPKIYAFDLLGAGFGALGVIIALYLLKPSDVLQLIAVAGLLASVVAAFESRLAQRKRVAVLLLAFLFLPEQWLVPNMSEYKALKQTLLISGTMVKEEHSSPLGLVTLLESRETPLRLAPGMSLNSSVEPPPQFGLFVDGDGPGAITRYDGNRESLVYLDYLGSALPYHLREIEKVLIVGMGGGSDILQAEFFGADQIDAVEVNPQIASLFQHAYGGFSGWSLLQEKIRIHISDARGFVAGSREKYDLIQLSLLDSAAASSAGLYALNENYLYTREGIKAYLDHLREGGLLSITRWVKLPPKGGLKLFATAVEALRLSGVSNPGDQLVMIRGWNTSVLVIKNGPFTEQEIRQLISFCDARSFDLVFYPGITPEQINTYNILQEPYYYQGVTALLGDDPARFISDYKFDIRPATDDRPYFFHFFKWSTLSEILPLYRQGGVTLLDLGYPVLILTLLQALFASLVLILLPLWFLKREKRKIEKNYPWKVVIYFTAIGLAFLFIEIAFIQKFMLFLANPIYAVAVVLCGFLIFSGIGSQYAGHLLKQGRNRPLPPVILTLGVIALGYLWLLPPLFIWLAVLPDVAKVVITLVLIAPLAFCMGMPFPLGLAHVAGYAPHLLPWAWGVNGCASLISAILATLLAIHLGFTWVILLAVLLYSLAAFLELRIVPWGQTIIRRKVN
ncbi:MAG: spermidine synthase [Gammaproteobacteria bacterium (ex Lamellibrachia satsuma)]|nr:MAG: SAM-dependent methyltransferase [Gammaproteobacteria bacterium (ex Lamellibrachia satsuma)]RRS31574.1 MAG: spermidine synthase [Gammaproteobacteria bacterium (ex Lamellibrachia satsuma)]